MYDDLVPALRFSNTNIDLIIKSVPIYLELFTIFACVFGFGEILDIWPLSLMHHIGHSLLGYPFGRLQ